MCHSLTQMTYVSFPASQVMGFGAIRGAIREAGPYGPYGPYGFF